MVLTNINNLKSNEFLYCFYFRYPNTFCSCYYKIPNNTLLMIISQNNLYVYKYIYNFMNNSFLKK